MSNNVWYELGKEYRKVYNDNDLNIFLKRNNLYTTINSIADSSFKKGTFQKFILELAKKEVNISNLCEMYLDYTEDIKGMDKYLFFLGYDIQKLNN